MRFYSRSLMSKLAEPNPSLLCAHTGGSYRKGHRLICGQCKSFYDLDFIKQEYSYTDSYAEQRSHCNNGEIGDLKIKTMIVWLRTSHLLENIGNMNVCEVGFGGGICLEYLHRITKGAWGIEITKSTLENAISLGIPRHNLYSYADLPKKLPQEIDLWLFQDSFEHIVKNLYPFLQWIMNNSSSHAQILLVAPQAWLLSRIIMGRYWLHQTPFHLFHWSYEGLCEMFKIFNFHSTMKFFPVKYINLSMVLVHLSIKFKFSRKVNEKIIPRISFPFNFGEMGIVFEKKLRSD